MDDPRRNISPVLDEIERCFAPVESPLTISREQARELRSSGWESVSKPSGLRPTSGGNAAVYRVLEKVLSYSDVGLQGDRRRLGQALAEAARRVRARIRTELQDEHGLRVEDDGRSYSFAPVDMYATSLESDARPAPTTTPASDTPLRLLLRQTVTLYGLSPLAPSSRIPPHVSAIATQIDAIYDQALASLKLRQVGVSHQDRLDTFSTALEQHLQVRSGIRPVDAYEASTATPSKTPPAMASPLASPLSDATTSNNSYHSGPRAPRASSPPVHLPGRKGAPMTKEELTKEMDELFAMIGGEADAGAR